MKLLSVMFSLFFLTFGMENEDLFKLRAQDFKTKVDSMSYSRLFNFLKYGDLIADPKSNKGSFYKAEKDGKFIYFLGTIPDQGASPSFIDDTVNKVKEQFLKDGNVIQVYWTELSKEKMVQIAGQELKKLAAKQLDIDDMHPKFATAFDEKANEGEERRWYDNWMKYSYQDKLSLNCKVQQLETVSFPCLYIPAELYCKGNNVEMAKYIAKAFTKETFRDFIMHNMELEKRNKNWVDMISSENAIAQLVVVDNFHTWFKTGVLMLLKEKGWQIEHIDFNLKTAPIPTRMEDEDLFKLSAKEFKDAVDVRESTVQTSTKSNKGSFFKATKNKKTIYYLGTVHYLASQDFIDYTAEKIYAQFKKDGNDEVGTLWTETTEKKVKQVLIDEAKQEVETLGSDNMEERIKEKLDWANSATDQKYTKKFAGKVWKFLDTEDVQDRIRLTGFQRLKQQDQQKLKEALNDQVVDNTETRKYTAEEALELAHVYPVVEAYHQGNYFEHAKLNNSGTGEEVAAMKDIIEFETRNERWVGLLESENFDVQFVIAGAEHAWYKTGVPMLLKKKGWEIEHIDLDIADFSRALKTDVLKHWATYPALFSFAASTDHQVNVGCNFFCCY